MQRSTVVNFILFQLAWLIAVWAAARGHGWLGPVTVGLWVMAFMAWHRPARKDTTLLIVTGLIGFFMDSILVWSGSIQFPEWAGPAFPTTVWMVALWVNLAASLRHSLKWLTGRYGLGIVFGAVGGPLAYLAGEKLNAIVVIELPVVVAAWAIAMPLILWAERITSGDTVVDASSVEPRERARES
jgi:hypothetical protein